MSQPVLLKVYANAYPSTPELLTALEEVTQDAIPCEDGAQILFDEGSIARISFEGIYFPVDEVREAFTTHITPETQGKMDVLDLEEWTLTRSFFKGGKVETRSQSLNSVMDYNGF